MSEEYTVSGEWWVAEAHQTHGMLQLAAGSCRAGVE